MAELVVTMAIGPLVSMLRDKASSYLLDQYNVMEGMEKQHRILKRRLPIILDVIADAEEQATAHREGAKAWLQELKTVAYEAHGVFDEFKYEALRRRAKKNGHYKELGFSGIKLLTTHNRVVFRRRMGRKLSMILQDINVLIAEMHDFGLRQTLPVSKQLRQTPESKQWRLTDYVIIDPQDIARRSRDKEKKNVVDVLLGQASSPDLIVVPIVGMGGIGKTTLAQLIYNEPEVQKHFQLLLWVCVSDTFDVNSLAKSIIEASPKKNEDIDKPPLDRLQKLVSGQRYLLVLDDVWNREVHKWERLKVCLQHGGTGSAVLTTTRDKRVAEIMSADRTYHLNDLEDRFLKEIIEAKAFGSREKPAELVKMVPEIVERCSGSPLAATALGSILCTKTSVKEWEDVSSRISICTEESGIFPILMLAYNELPSHMKKCFAFCALFPKDYKIDVEKLIQLWIANGFISEQNAESLETIGKYIFNELASRSFFVDIVQSKTEWEYYSRTTCKIHDLMHDIAMSVMENQTIVATEESSHIDIERLPDTAQHLFLSREKRKGMFLSREETDGNSSEYVKKISPVIRTLICDTYTGGSLQRLSKYNSLHALKLHIGRESFLPKPRYLRYLRYLDLSGSFIKALPEDISILYNLQMLDLSNCLFLDRLPSQLKYMTSLRHLYTHGCPELKSMPPGLRKLTKLQTLTCFVVAVTGPDCSDVAELQHLNLGGQLELCQIENIDKEAEKKVSYLGNKEDLRELTLRWTFVCDSEVLNKFEPHNRLQVLRIHYYGGKCMGMLQNMVEIHLFHCERLQFLVRGNTSFIYPKLKHLTLEHLLNFERWWDINESQGEQIIFPQLEKLFIRYCGKLVSFLQEPCSGGGYRLVHTAFPALKVLEVNDLESFQRWDAAVEGEKILFPRLEKLYIKKCPKLIALPEACSGGDKLGRLEFPALKVLEMKDLESFQRWHVVVEGEQMLFPLLEKLSIQKCPKLIDLPEAPILGVLEIEDGAQEIFHWVERYMASLTNLKLNLKYTETLSEAKRTSIEPVESEEKRNQKCPIIFMELGCCNSFFRLGALEKWNYYEKLEDLHINRCDVLVHWPEQVFKSLVSLRRLAIRNCENLAGYAQAPLEPSTSRRSKHLPDLKVLDIHDCGSLVEMFNIPTSLKRMTICGCIKLESIFGKQQGTSELVEGFSCSEAITRTAISELASSPMNHFCPCLEYLYLSRCDSLSEVLNLPWSLKVITIDRCSDINVLSSQLVEIQKPSTAAAAAGGGGEHSLPPRLESLTMLSCDSMIGILRLPTSLKRLNIQHCRGLTSLNIESELLPNEPPLLVSLWLDSCRNLAFLPNDPQVYHALERLRIKDCPAIKKLPRCLKQQLGSINSKELDACYEVTAFKPKTWKQIPRLVGQWRQSHCI